MSSNTVMFPVMFPMRAMFHFRPIQNAAVIRRSGRSVQKIAPIIARVSGLPVGTLIVGPWKCSRIDSWAVYVRQIRRILSLVSHASLQGGGAHDIADDAWISTWTEDILACTRVPWIHGPLGDVFSLCFRAWGVLSLIETFVPHIQKWVPCLFWGIPQCNDGHAWWIY